MRSRLEGGFGQTLGQVRLHDDAQAARLSGALNANAVTMGSHVFLGAVQSPNRLGLLAHEVAHALQQSGASPGGTLGASRPGDACERAADDAALSIARGLPARPGPATGLQVTRQPRGGSASGLSEEQLEDLAAIGEPPSPFIRMASDPPYEVQMARYQRGKARQQARAADDALRIQGEQATWDAQVLHDQIEDSTRIDSLSDVGRVLMGGMRWNQANIRQGGEDLEQWLQDSQKKSTAQAYSYADQHQDDWYGGLLRASAVFQDMSSEFTTGIARGGVTMGSGLLGAVANPFDTTSGLLELGNDLVNPFADKKELNAAAEGLYQPYAKAVGEGRYLEAGGRLFFDVASMLVGAGEARTLAKGTGTAAKAPRLAAPAMSAQEASQVAQTMGRKIATSPGSETAFRQAAAEIAESMRANGLTAQAENFLKEADAAIAEGLKAHEQTMKSGKGYGGPTPERVDYVEQPGAGAKGRPKHLDLSENPNSTGGGLWRYWP